MNKRLSDMIAPVSSPFRQQTWRNFMLKLRQHSLASVFLCLSTIIALGALLALAFSLGHIPINKTIRLSGYVTAIEPAVPVAHDTSGIIDEIFVTEGEMVQEGQVLISLQAEGLSDKLATTQRQVIDMLASIECLTAQRDLAAHFEPSRDLRRLMGRFKQLEQFHRQQRDCQRALDQLWLKRQLSNLEQANKHDIAQLQSSLAQHSLLTQMPTGGATQSPIAMPSIIKRQIDAKQAQGEHSASRISRSIENITHLDAFDQKIDDATDQLSAAEAELARLDALMKNRFIYAPTSGRIQRLRIAATGKRLAAGAYFLEIAPIQTDFEVHLRASAIDIRDLEIGQTVQVQLSGTVSREQWVPGDVQSISELSQEQRLVRVFLRRADLNKRDLLQGDQSLNGLNERSQAQISFEPESALQSLVNALLYRFHLDDLPSS